MSTERRGDAKEAVCRAGVGLAGAALLVAVVVGGAASPAQAVTAEDAVLDWNRYASRRSSCTSAPACKVGRGPTVAILHLAIVQGAVYDAVNMIDGGREPYMDDLPQAPSSASAPARSRPRRTACSSAWSSSRL